MADIRVGTSVDIEYPTPEGVKTAAKAEVIATDGTTMTLQWKDPAGNTHRKQFPVAMAYDK